MVYVWNWVNHKKGWKLNCILVLVLIVSVGFLASPASGASVGNLVLARIAGVETGMPMMCTLMTMLHT